MTQTHVMLWLEVEEGRTLLCEPAADSYGNRVGTSGGWAGYTHFKMQPPLHCYTVEEALVLSRVLNVQNNSSELCYIIHYWCNNA